MTPVFLSGTCVGKALGLLAFAEAGQCLSLMGRGRGTGETVPRPFRGPCSLAKTCGDGTRQSPPKAGESYRGLSPMEELVRRKVVAMRNALGWSQSRCAIETAKGLTSVECYEHPDPRTHRGIRADYYETLRAAAEQAGLDSCGKLRIPERKAG